MRRNARVADGAEDGPVPAVDLLAVAAEAGIMVRVTPGNVRAGGGADAVRLCFRSDRVAVRTFQTAAMRFVPEQRIITAGLCRRGDTRGAAAATLRLTLSLRLRGGGRRGPLVNEE